MSFQELPLCINTSEDDIPVIHVDFLSKNKSIRDKIQKLAIQKCILILFEYGLPILKRDNLLEIELMYYDGPHPIIIEANEINSLNQDVIPLLFLKNKLNEMIGPNLIYPDDEPDNLEDFVCCVFPIIREWKNEFEFKKNIQEAYNELFGSDAFDEWENIKERKVLEKKLPKTPLKPINQRL